MLAPEPRDVTGFGERVSADVRESEIWTCGRDAGRPGGPRAPSYHRTRRGEMRPTWKLGAVG